MSCVRKYTSDYGRRYQETDRTQANHSSRRPEMKWAAIRPPSALRCFAVRAGIQDSAAPDDDKSGDHNSGFAPRRSRNTIRQGLKFGPRLRRPKSPEDTHHGECPDGLQSDYQSVAHRYPRFRESSPLAPPGFIQCIDQDERG